MRNTVHLENNILAYAIKDRDFYNRVKPALSNKNFSCFSDEKRQMVFDRLSTVEHKKEDDRIYAIKYEFERDRELENIEYYISVIDIALKSDPIPIDIVERDTIELVKRQSTAFALKKAKEEFDDSNYDNLSKFFNQAETITFDKDLGSSIKDFTKNLTSIKKLNDENVISSGLSTLDGYLEGGFKNRELTVVCAPPGVGKTLFLGSIAMNAFSMGKKVLFYTLETSKDRLFMRYYNNLTGMKKTQILSDDDNEAEKKIEEIIQNEKNFSQGDLIVKEYPANTANCNMFLAHMADLKRLKDWTPDIIIIDYLLIMNTNEKSYASDNSYKYYKTVCEEVRNLAVMMNVPVLSACQLNRNSTSDTNTGTKNNVSLSTISESRGIVDTSDIILLITQTEAERKAKKMNILIAKNRNGENAIKIPLNVDYDRMKLSVFQK